MSSTVIAAMSATVAASCLLALASRRGDGAPVLLEDPGEARTALTAMYAGGYGLLMYALIFWAAALGWEIGIPVFLGVLMTAGAVAVFLKAGHLVFLKWLASATVIASIAAGGFATTFAGG